MAHKDDSFKEYVEDELLREVDGISVRTLFGGHGIYRHGVCIGLIHSGMLYFKVDSVSQKDYEAEGSKPFMYTGHTGKTVALSFWEVPGIVADNPEAIYPWAIAAYEAALRAKKKK
ncbi:MAG TPA: TfoX/Sxy family protein [Patescibacteria group bacterium]|nr:TfoX/Sxy family protein [Patescibacteria group bacterium]